MERKLQQEVVVAFFATTASDRKIIWEKLFTFRILRDNQVVG